MEQLIEYIKYFALTVLGGFLGYFIRLFIEHRLAIDRNRDNIKITEFNKASATFRAAFISTVCFLRQNIEIGDKIVRQVITSALLINQEYAKILFEPFMVDNLNSFDEAWDAYKDYEENYYKKLAKSPESIIENEPNRNKDISQYCLTHLDNLLKYAKPKIK